MVIVIGHVSNDSTSIPVFTIYPQILYNSALKQ